jgi:RsiW-degrading membrane proteinase PrsW (M82 family)
MPPELLRPAGEPPVPDPALTPRRRSAARLVVSLLAVLLLAACGVLTLAVVLSDTGPLGLVIGLVLAVVPVFPVVAAFLWLDRYEAEPPALLLFAFGWGAFVATFLSLVVNTTSSLVLQRSGGDPGLTAVFVAPVVEEVSKGLVVLLILLMRRKEFDGVVDGIVYAGMAGIGFAFVENILYLGRSFLEAGSAAAVATFVVRCVFSPFAHPLFTMATGVGLGLAARYRSPLVRLFAPLAGLLVAIALHGTWNASASFGFDGFIGTYVLVQIPLFLLAIAVAVLARAREGRLLRRHLTAYAGSGWLTAAEVRMLTSLHERARARDWAGRTFGPVAKRSMRAFQEQASELAFLRERMARGTAARDAGDVELRTLQTLWHLRRGFLPQPVDAAR